MGRQKKKISEKHDGVNVKGQALLMGKGRGMDGGNYTNDYMLRESMEEEKFLTNIKRNNILSQIKGRLFIQK